MLTLCSDASFLRWTSYSVKVEIVEVLTFRRLGQLEPPQKSYDSSRKTYLISASA